MTASVSPEVIENWRSEFELLIADDSHLSASKHDTGAYVDDATYNAFYWFCVSRQSAVIELNLRQYIVDGLPNKTVAVKELISSIESQGYQVNFNPPHGD